MKFVKMHGTGNDYVYINLIPGHMDSVAASYDLDGTLLRVMGKDVTEVARRVSDRHFGVGSDGLIGIAPSSQADVRMIMFNADGSEGAMCGNGIRCVAKFAYDRGLLKVSGDGQDHPVITVETASGIKTLTLTIEKNECIFVEVNMGEAILKPELIPVKSESFGDSTLDLAGIGLDEDLIVSRPIEVNGKTYHGTCVSMGNPHLVIFTEGIDELDLERIGPDFENHEAFPDRINTEFVEVIDDHTVRMRVWERGSGETISCGTGTCAVTVASVLNGYVVQGRETIVQIRGGELYDTYMASGEVLMRGPAETVFEGDFTV